MPRAHAATITVNETTCTLVDAILAANTNSSVNGCVSGAVGEDTIVLATDVELTAVHETAYGSPTGLPVITQDLIIDGAGFTINRDDAEDEFRLMNVGDGVDLALNDVTLSGGHSQVHAGGVYAYRGDLTLDNVVMEDNHGGDRSYVAAFYQLYDSNSYGGAIYVGDGDLTITGSLLTGNTAVAEFCYDDPVYGVYCQYSGRGGAIFHHTGNLIIRESTISYNEAFRDGGGLFFDGGDITYDAYYEPIAASDDTAEIDDSQFTNNVAGSYGGGIYHEHGAMTIRRTTISGNQADSGGGIYQEISPLALIEVTLDDNYAREDGGAVYSDGPLTILRSTLSNNDSDSDGGAIYVSDYGSVAVTNSTISGNTSSGDGGGIYFGMVEDEDGDLFNLYPPLNNTLDHVTVTNNDAGDQGGGIYADGTDSVYGEIPPTVTITRSIISGNTTTDSEGDDLFAFAAYSYDATIVLDADNVLGDSGKTTADALEGTTAGATDVLATSDGPTPTALAAILNPALANNGGPTLTHALVSGSPAIDLAATGESTDQRNYGRPAGADHDAGAYEYGAVPASDDVFVSASTAGITDDAVAFGPHDILRWDGSAWSKWFDGTAAGLTPNGKAKHNINAIWVPDPAEDAVYMAFAQNARFVPGITGKVDGMDIVRWSSDDGFELAFDGQDVGLTNLTNEKIDAFHALDGSESPVGAGCIAYLLISTQGPGKVPGVGSFSGEDVLGFCLINDGSATTGVWHKLIDGSNEGMPRNATVNLSASEDGQTLYLTTRAEFTVDSASGGHSMVYEFDLTSGTFSGPVFVAADEGLHQVMDALEYE